MTVCRGAWLWGVGLFLAAHEGQVAHHAVFDICGVASRTFVVDGSIVCLHPGGLQLGCHVAL